MGIPIPQPSPPPRSAKWGELERDGILLDQFQRIRATVAYPREGRHHVEDSIFRGPRTVNEEELRRLQVPLARVLSEEEEDDDDEVDDDPEDDEVWEDPTGGLVTRLFNLASDGKLEDLALLLDGLDSSTVNLQGPDGDTALHLAAVYGQASCVRVLLEGGADPTVEDHGNALPLHDAASGGHLACARLLLDAAPRTVNAVDDDGDTPLHNAARSDQPDMVALLLARGADAGLCNNMGLRPLDLVEGGEHSRTIRTTRILQNATLVSGSAGAQVA